MVSSVMQVVENLPTFFVRMHNPGLERRNCTSGQRIWRSAMSRRSKGALSAMAAQLRAAAAVATLESGQDSASATTLDIPGTCTSWVVYSEMKARWRCWWPDDGGDTLVRAHNSDLLPTFEPGAEVLNT